MNKDILLVGRYFIKFYESYCAQVCAKHKLTQMELDVIAFLSNNPELDTASDIVEVRQFTKSNISLAVEQLIQRKLLVRQSDKQDRRKIHLVLTTSSKPIVKDIKKMQDDFSNDVVCDFSDEEKQLFNEFITRMITNILNGIGRAKKNAE
ncbi:MarR family winged helix-turn-helix transcriptional regulator [Anaerorhabdus sp.]|uniref:MarR family winged helix-turn-helix transcriptional regulator n=1 Tax=Anaerorhabdus sp. TaxID=1872524 RepID=UPI002FC79189